MAEENLDDKELQKQRNDANNTKNVRNAADVAMATGHPVGVVAGGAVKVADKATGGKASELAGKTLSKVGKVIPGGNQFQRASNKLSESGISDAAGKVASIKNTRDQRQLNHPSNQTDQNNATKKDENMKDRGGEQSSSLPSSSDKEKKNSSKSDSNDDSEKSEGFLKNAGKFILSIGIVNTIIIFFLPVLLIIVLLLSIISGIGGIFGEFSDGFGISAIIGEEIEGFNFEAEEEDQAFYNRINDVTNEYLEKGLVVDPYKVVATFHILRNNNSKIEYSKIKKNEVEWVASMMFDENGIASDEVFRKNLVDKVIPKYISKTTKEEREAMVDDIYEYIENYNELVGRDSKNTLCSTGSGVCHYDIKGYYVVGKGNVSETTSPSNLYIRMMDCNNTSKALEGEDLIPFEKYIMGVTYSVMGENAPVEAIKAQSIIERNYFLGQHTALGGYRTLKKESDKWVLQISSCAQGLTYCDPDKGCSTLKSLPENSAFRRAVRSVEGEILENAQGYAIYPNYASKDKQDIISLANRGYTYKQILMQYYNQGSHSYGASDIAKNSCSDGMKATNCISNGEFSKWKQTDPAWSSTPMGNSGKTLGQIGCLVTSVAMQIAKSGVKTNISNFNPGTFVQFLNKNGGFAAGGNFVWAAATKVAPSFQYQGSISIAGMTREQKLAKIRELSSVKGIYVVAEVMGNTGQHWVAIDSVTGNTINIMDSGNRSGNTNMWAQYNWINTSTLAYYRVS